MFGGGGNYSRFGQGDAVMSKTTADRITRVNNQNEVDTKQSLKAQEKQLKEDHKWEQKSLNQELKDRKATEKRRLELDQQKGELEHRGRQLMK